MNLERKVYETRSQKVGDFFLGVGLSIGLNVALSLILSLATGGITSVTSNINNDMAQSILGILISIAYGLPCLLQLGLIIYFGLTRYWIALGMLATIAFGLLLALLLAAACFALIAGMSGGFGK
jgi:ABC-type amino acid transport system permease subunit